LWKNEKNCDRKEERDGGDEKDHVPTFGFGDYLKGTKREGKGCSSV